MCRYLEMLPYYLNFMMWAWQLIWFLFLCSVVTSFATVSTNMQNIPMLNESDFKDRKETLLITLGCMNLDLALRTEKPTPLTDVSTADLKRDFERWERLVLNVRSRSMQPKVIKRFSFQSLKLDPSNIGMFCTLVDTVAEDVITEQRNKTKLIVMLIS